MPKALFVEITARTDAHQAVHDFLHGALAAAEQEPDTRDWYALRFDTHHFALFDTFDGNLGRLKHLAGEIGRGLAVRTLTQFEGLPDIATAELVAAKLPKPDAAPRLALYAAIETRLGQGRDFGEVLVEASRLVAEEPGTIASYVLRTGPNHFAIIGFFADEAGLQAHAGGAVPGLIGRQVGRYLDAMPEIRRAEVIASKSSGLAGMVSAEQQVHPEQGLRIAPEAP